MKKLKIVVAVLAIVGIALGAITTVDGIVGAVARFDLYFKNGAATTIGRYYSPFYVTGKPGAAVAPSPGISGAALTTYAGQLTFQNPASGNSHISLFSARANVAGTLCLCDRLWHNSGISVTSTGSQAINSVAWPARDSAGTTDGTNIIIGVEVSTVMGAGTPTWTMGYTNSVGTAGRSVVTAAQTATMAVGSFIWIPLAAGDNGVRSIQTWQQSATMTSGVYHLVAFRILAPCLPMPLANVASLLDFAGTSFPRVYDNTVPFLIWLPATTTAPNIAGEITIVQG